MPATAAPERAPRPVAHLYRDLSRDEHPMPMHPTTEHEIIDTAGRRPAELPLEVAERVVLRPAMETAFRERRVARQGRNTGWHGLSPLD